MRLSFYFGASQLTLFILALLCPLPQAVTVSQSPTTFFPTRDRRELESVLHYLQFALQNARDPKTQPGWAQDALQAVLEPEEEEEEDEENNKPWGYETLLRGQRRDLPDMPLSAFPGENSLETMHYQEGGEGEEGWKRNDALTSMAGGLQAVSREKGGFGFRFGKKRWTERKKRGEWFGTQRSFNWDERRD